MYDNKDSHTWKYVKPSWKTVWYYLMRLNEYCISDPITQNSVHITEICMLMNSKIKIRMLRAALFINS